MCPEASRVPQTVLERPGSVKAELHPHDRYAVASGDMVRFGVVECRLELSPAGEAPQARSHKSPISGVLQRWRYSDLPKEL